MGEFFDSISGDLDALDASRFGVEYTDPTVVKAVQTKLNALGASPQLTVDGQMGPETAAAITAYQGTQNFPMSGLTGAVDDATLAALGLTSTGAPIPAATPASGGSASAALAAIQQEFASLISWATKNPQPITQGKGIAPGFQATRASVVNSYTDWTTPLEGFVPFMYIDALGYVTTGMGNLIDPVSAALALPWKNSDGSAASPAQIQAAWAAVDAQRSDPKGQKQTSGPATRGGGSQGGVTSIRITKDDVKNIVAAKLKENESYLLKGLSSFADAPADAQLAAHSMAWAMGPGFATTWTQFRDAFNKADYTTAAAQSNMKGVGIDNRNLANKLLLTNASQVVTSKADPDYLYYIDGLAKLFSGLGVLAPVSPMAIIANIQAHPYRSAGIAAGVIAFVGILLAAALKTPQRKAA
jgi:peptidoglycan hydrolase-like protein with peptidoglycan-binding domain